MPTEVALAFNKEAGLLLFVDVPALFVVFCDVEAVCKKLQTNRKQQLKDKTQTQTQQKIFNYIYIPCIGFALLLVLLWLVRLLLH